MGTPIIEPEFGVNCWNWNPPAETPKYLYVFFYDVIKGNRPGAVEPPNLHIFKVPQKPGSPCVWEYWNPAFGWWVQVGNQGGNSWLWLGDHDLFPNYYFIDDTGPQPFPEYQIYDNVFNSPVATWGYNGHGTIFWLPTVRELAESFGLAEVDDVNLEMFTDPSADMVHKFVSLTLRTNVRIKYSP